MHIVYKRRDKNCTGIAEFYKNWITANQYTHPEHYDKPLSDDELARLRLDLPKQQPRNFKFENDPSKLPGWQSNIDTLLLKRRNDDARSECDERESVTGMDGLTLGKRRKSNDTESVKSMEGDGIEGNGSGEHTDDPGLVDSVDHLEEGPLKEILKAMRDSQRSMQKKLRDCQRRHAIDMRNIDKMMASVNNLTKIGTGFKLIASSIEQMGDDFIDAIPSINLCD